jgi:TfoX/Sxy family transcriptional regulator of competence genes
VAYSEELAERMRTALAASRNLEERRMFGGLAFMVNGHMCCGVVGDELMVRVGPDLYQSSLAQPHTREMDFTGKPLQGLVYVGTQGIATERQLGEWVQRGLAFISTLPAR